LTIIYAVLFGIIIFLRICFFSIIENEKMSKYFENGADVRIQRHFYRNNLIFNITQIDLLLSEFVKCFIELIILCYSVEHVF
jgi:hypothetical protein